MGGGKVSQTLQVQNDLVGRIIGKQGSSIKEIQVSACCALVAMKWALPTNSASLCIRLFSVHICWSFVFFLSLTRTLES